MNATTARRPCRLSAQMLAVLRLAAAGQPLNADARGRSEHGGLGMTVAGLMRRGLLDRQQKITAAGRAALASRSTQPNGGEHV